MGALMTHRSRPTLRRATALTVAAGLLSFALVGCSSGPGDDEAQRDASDIATALQKKTTLTVWSWAPGVQKVATAFEKKHPKVTVEVVNAGSGDTEYTKLQNAIKAGKGVPDIAQIAYFALPQFALAGSLTNLKKFGFDDLEGKFTESTWNSVNLKGGLYGLPEDSGPMALFYNKTVFDKYGVAIPKTWEEFVTAAKKLQAADPKVYITSDTGDPNLAMGLIWQAGGKPFSTHGTTVDVNLQDAGAKRYAELWDRMITADLVAPIPYWSDEWYRGLANGTIASLVTGAWMPSDLESGVKAGAGQWRVAPMPTWKDEKYGADYGASSNAVMKQSTNKLAAAGLLKFMSTGEGAQIFADIGGFPAQTSILNSASFLDATPAYFGGQKINQVLVRAAKDVVPGQKFVPFQVYANHVFGDTVGQAYTKKTDLNGGLKAWQKAIVTYGNQQGFTVKGK